MKTFKQFILENFMDDESALNDKAKIISICESSDETYTIEENIESRFDGKLDWRNFREFFQEETIDESGDSAYDYSRIGEPGTTFGDETIIDLDFGSLSESRKKDNEDDEDKKQTIPYLMARSGKNDMPHHSVSSMDDIKNMGKRYKVDPQNGVPRNGKVSITVKKYYEPEERRHQLTKDEIEAVIKQKNKKPPLPNEYSFDENGNFLQNGVKKSRDQKIGFIKKLNSLVEIIKQELGDKTLRHYKWNVVGHMKTYPKGHKHAGEDIKGSNLGNRIMYNSTDWDDEDKQDLKRYDKTEYLPIEKGSEQERELLGYINTLQKADGNKQEDKDKDEYGWDDQIKTFTVNGKPIVGDDLLNLIGQLNSHMTDDKKADIYTPNKKGNVTNKKGDSGSYWKHFKVSIQGSKVGDVANFSLPPVITCNKDAPCINDGCYAIASYGMYPTSRMAQEVNLRLLNEGKYDQLEDEISMLLKMKNKENEQKFKYFRFFVSGDMPSYKMLDSICNIAGRNGTVRFWMYTKQYQILMDYKKQIPDNLTILVSCWGQFCPKYYVPKGTKPDENGLGPYAELEERFPLAYLDDGTDSTRKFFDKKSGDEVCPCTEDDEVVARCDSCHKCFEASAKDGNIIFKKH